MRIYSKPKTYHGGLQAYTTKQKYCKNHPFAMWADGYKQCSEGFKKKENCEEGK